jgi:hypothetical protein
MNRAVELAEACRRDKRRGALGVKRGDKWAVVSRGQSYVPRTRMSTRHTWSVSVVRSSTKRTRKRGKT